MSEMYAIKKDLEKANEQNSRLTLEIDRKSQEMPKGYPDTGR